MRRKYRGLWAGVEWALCPSVSGWADPGIPDLSGNGHDGVRFGSSTQSGVEEGKYCCDIQGNNGCFDITNTQDWATDEGSMSVWVRTDSTVGDKYLVARNRAGDNAGDFGFYIAAGHTPDMFSFFIQDGAGGGGINARAEEIGLPSTTVWQNYVILWSSTEKSMWVDGVKQSITGGGITLSAHANDDFTWGWSGSNHTDGGGPDFNGATDDLAAWNRLLDADEIRLLYQLGRGGWHAEEGVTVFSGGWAPVDPLNFLSASAMQMSPPPPPPSWKAVSYQT